MRADLETGAMVEQGGVETLSYHNEREDMVTFNTEFLSHNTFYRAFFSFIVWGGAVLIFGVAVVSRSIARGGADLLSIATFAVAALLFVPVCRWLIRAFGKWTVRLAIGLRDNPGFPGEHRLTAGPDALVEEFTSDPGASTGSGRNTFPWSAVKGIHQGKDFVYVYVGSAAAHVIPRNRIQEGNVDTFVAAVERFRNEGSRQEKTTV
jgi:hypothetical protein